MFLVIAIAIQSMSSLVSIPFFVVMLYAFQTFNEFKANPLWVMYIRIT